MGKAKKTRSAKLFSIKNNGVKAERRNKNLGKPDHQKLQIGPTPKQKKEDPNKLKINHHTQVSSAMFFKYNTQLGPPYHVILDTNFINFSIRNKLDIFQSLFACLDAKVTPYVTKCVVAELESLGEKYKLALKLLKDERIKHLECLHAGQYADDCIIRRVEQSKCYMVATNDRDLKRRIRKIAGVPIMYIANHKYQIERMPDLIGGS